MVYGVVTQGQRRYWKATIVVEVVGCMYHTFCLKFAIWQWLSEAVRVFSPFQITVVFWWSSSYTFCLSTAWTDPAWMERFSGSSCTVPNWAVCIGKLPRYSSFGPSYSERCWDSLATFLMRFHDKRQAWPPRLKARHCKIQATCNLSWHDCTLRLYGSTWSLFGAGTWQLPICCQKPELWNVTTFSQV